jgi:hypothetical protein
VAKSAKQGKSGKRKREHKVSKGEHGGGGKVKLTVVQKALMGKGIAHNAGSRSKPKARKGA